MDRRRRLAGLGALALWDRARAGGSDDSDEDAAEQQQPVAAGRDRLLLLGRVRVASTVHSCSNCM